MRKHRCWMEIVLSTSFTNEMNHISLHCYLLASFMFCWLYIKAKTCFEWSHFNQESLREIIINLSDLILDHKQVRMWRQGTFAIMLCIIEINLHSVTTLDVIPITCTQFQEFNSDALYLLELEFCNGTFTDGKLEVQYVLTPANLSCPLISPEFRNISSTCQNVMPATPSVSDYGCRACAAYRVETICFFFVLVLALLIKLIGCFAPRKQQAEQVPEEEKL